MVQEDPDIKIFVACHKPAFVPTIPYIVPIQVGTALSGDRIPGMLHDDTGDNISQKNRSYCELTAQYWAWKNIDAEYYGFFHYRRYLSFRPEDHTDDIWGNLNFDTFDNEMLQKTGLDPETMRNLITKFDVLAVRGRNLTTVPEAGKLPRNIYEEYGMAPFQHREDLDIAISILKQKYPEFTSAADTYLAGNIAHECNMFVMKREIFQKYASWLFSILKEAETKIDTSLYDEEEFRVFGYLAERLCGIYCTYLREKTKIRYLEVPKALIRNTDPRDLEIQPVYSNAVSIVTSANNRFAPYLDVFLRSLILHSSSKRNYDILVLYDDITKQNQEIIQRAAKNYPNVTIRFAQVSRYFDGNELFIDQHLSVETYYRLIIPEIMPKYHKILYLDCDLVINHDVAQLFDLPLSGSVLAGAEDIDVAGLRKTNQNGWKDYAEKELGLSEKDRYFQAGVLLLDLDVMRKITSSRELIQLAASHKFRCHDQDVLNRIFAGRFRTLPQRWNVLMNWEEVSGEERMALLRRAPHELFYEYLEARKNPYIVHFAGYQKPWNVVDCDLAYYFWEVAITSPYYPLMIRRIRTSLEEQREQNGRTAGQKLRALQNHYFPRGTRRRTLIDRIYLKLHRK